MRFSWWARRERLPQVSWGHCCGRRKGFLHYCLTSSCLSLVPVCVCVRMCVVFLAALPTGIYKFMWVIALEFIILCGVDVAAQYLQSIELKPPWTEVSLTLRSCSQSSLFRSPQILLSLPSIYFRIDAPIIPPSLSLTSELALFSFLPQIFLKDKELPHFIIPVVPHIHGGYILRLPMPVENLGQY